MTRIYKTQLKKSKQKQSILSFSLWRSSPVNPTQISNNPNLQKLRKTQCSLLLLDLLEIMKWRCYFMRGRKKRWCGLTIVISILEKREKENFCLQWTRNLRREDVWFIACVNCWYNEYNFIIILLRIKLKDVGKFYLYRRL